MLKKAEWFAIKITLKQCHVYRLTVANESQQDKTSKTKEFKNKIPEWLKEKKNMQNIS